jgi:ribonuclease D
VSASDPPSTSLPSAPLETLADAQAWLLRNEGARALALDTEGDGMFRYRTQLCTVQLCAVEARGSAREQNVAAREQGGHAICVIDTLRVPPAPLLNAALGPDGPEKIIHDASFDARILFAYGVVLGNVFDTAVAARFLGFSSTGLSSLLLKLFGVHLPKSQQQADWGKRPIDAEAMRYLEDDVRFLPALYERLLQEVRARDIEPEVREECRYLLREAQRSELSEPAWMRLKGAAQRPPRERARLVELAATREQLARERDVPPARLLASELLLRLSQDDAADPATLLRLLGNKAELAPDLAQALERARGAADAPRDQLERMLPDPPSTAELTRRKRRKAWLSEFRTREAKARDVDPQVVLPGHCLADLLDLATLDEASLRALPGFGECRFARYGATLIAMPRALGE